MDGNNGAKKDYPKYENTPRGYIGFCYMKGHQGVDGSKYTIKNYTNNLVEIVRK